MSEDVTLKIGDERSITVSPIESGGVVLMIEDPLGIAILELSREQADELMSALLPRELSE